MTNPSTILLGSKKKGSTMELKKFNVSVRCFDPRQGLESGHEYVLPVDSPDAERAASAAMSNAVAFTTKLDGAAVRPVAFCCTAVRERA